MPPITSVQNPRVKDAARLRDRRHREKQGRIVIDGARELRRAVESKTGVNVKLVEAFVCEPLCHGEDVGPLLAALEPSGCEIFQVTEAVFERLSFGSRSEGVLGIAEMPRPTLTDIRVPPNGLVAVLEAVEKPGNLGAILRSADAAGVSAVIMADARTDLFNPNAIRASLGTIFTMPVCEASSTDVLAWLRSHGFSIVAARVDGSRPYTEIDYRGPTAIVLGSEALGLTPAWSADDIRAVRLPMLGTADSLNVSATAAVLFYEALRQRT